MLTFYQIVIKAHYEFFKAVSVRVRDKKNVRFQRQNVTKRV